MLIPPGDRRLSQLLLPLHDLAIAPVELLVAPARQLLEATAMALQRFGQEAGAAALHQGGGILVLSELRQRIGCRPRYLLQFAQPALLVRPLQLPGQELPASGQDVPIRFGGLAPPFALDGPASPAVCDVEHDLRCAERPELTGAAIDPNRFFQVRLPPRAPKPVAQAVPEVVEARGQVGRVRRRRLHRLLKEPNRFFQVRLPPPAPQTAPA